MSKDTFKDRGFSEQKLALLASLLEKEGVPQGPRLPSWSALTPIRTGGSKPPLFCMHGAGGTVMMYRDLLGIWVTTSLSTACSRRAWTEAAHR